MVVDEPFFGSGLDDGGRLAGAFWSNHAPASAPLSSSSLSSLLLLLSSKRDFFGWQESLAWRWLSPLVLLPIPLSLPFRAARFRAPNGGRRAADGGADSAALAT